MSEVTNERRGGSLWVGGDPPPLEHAAEPRADAWVVSDESLDGTPTPTEPSRGKTGKIVTTVVIGGALVAAALAITHHGSSSSPTANTGGGFQNGGAVPNGGNNGTPPSGGVQGGGPGQFGSPVSGSTLAKLEAAVSAKYPGQVERAMQLPDGSYEVHVIQSNGEVHVLVNQDFQVTGVEQGGFRGGGPQGGSGQSGQAPNGASPTTPNGSSGTTTTQ